MAAGERAKLALFGTFDLSLADGRRLVIASKKGRALIALLALSPQGERSRVWLQERLWSRGDKAQAQASLRREFASLRTLLTTAGLDLLHSQPNSVQLDLDQLDVDALLPDARPPRGQTFLEGLSLAGETTFAAWLTEQRAAFGDPGAAALAVLPAGAGTSPASGASGVSIAVMPIVNLASDADADMLIDALGTDLVHGIGRLRWLRPMLPGAQLGAGADSLIEAGRRLASTYVFGGFLRAQGPDYWLSVQVVDSLSGEAIWSTRLRVPRALETSLRPSLVEDLVAGIDYRVDAAQQSRARAVTGDLSVDDLIWRGRWHQNRLTREDMAAAAGYFDAALERAPDYAQAIIERAQHLAYAIWNSRAPDDDTREIRAQAQRAMVVDPEDARGHMLAGLAETWLRRHGPAETILDRAFALNPSLAITLDQQATLYNLTARNTEAIAKLERSLTLCSTDFRQFYKQGELALARLMLGQNAQAAMHAEQSITLRPSYWHAHVIRINALVRGDRLADARRAAAELLASRKGFVSAYVDWVPFADRRWNDFLREGLDMALPS